MSRWRLGIRWTVGDVSARGFVALGLSLWGAWRLFGPGARYVVCANTVPIKTVRERVGPVPAGVEWLDVTRLLPGWLRAHLDAGLAEGTAWKLAPLRLWSDRKELALDNDCILWGVPAALRAWLEDEGESVLLAEDVRVCFGQFTTIYGPQPRNLGLRGLPAGLALEHAVATVLRERLPVAALTGDRRAHVVPLHDVSVSSPFPPHPPLLGRHGAHLCGVNARRPGWSRDERSADGHLAASWERHLAEVRERVERAGLDPALGC